MKKFLKTCESFYDPRAKNYEPQENNCEPQEKFCKAHEKYIQTSIICHICHPYCTENQQV